MSEVVVDARHLICPMPVIKTQEAINKLTMGDTVRVLCTDRGVLYDIPAWVRVHGHEIISRNSEQDSTHIEFIIRVR